MTAVERWQFRALVEEWQHSPQPLGGGLSFGVCLSLHPGVTRHSHRDPAPVCYQQQGNRASPSGPESLNDDLRVEPLTLAYAPYIVIS